MSARLPLLVTALLASLPLGACEPLQPGPIFGPQGTGDAGTAGSRDAGSLPDAGSRDAGSPPDAGSHDGGQLPHTDSGNCWQTRELAANVQNLAFRFDSQGVGHFAFNQDSGVHLGSTRPGELPIRVEALVGNVADLAVDAQGQRHLALNHDSMSLYAREQQGSWFYTELAPGTAPVQLKLDASGSAHLVLERQQTFGDRLAYVTNRNGFWEVARDLGVPGGTAQVDLELDARGKAHLTYCFSGASKLYYTTNASGEWVTESVASTPCHPLSLGLNAEGRPHLLYQDQGWLHHATKREGAWRSLPVGPAPGIAIDLKADAAGNLTALLDQEHNPLLASATLPSGAQHWSYTPILALEWEGADAHLRANVLGLDAAGGVHIGFWYGVVDSNGAPLSNSVRYAHPCPR